MKATRRNSSAAYPKAQRVIGVDWQHGQLYLAECRQRGPADCTIMAVNAFAVPPAFAPETPEFPHFLKEKLELFCGNSHDIRLWALLPENGSEQYFYRIPAVPARERESTAVWMAQKELNLDEKLMIYDVRIGDELMEQGTSKFPAIGVSVTHSAWQAMAAIVAKAGYRLEGAIPAAAAVRNIFVSGWAKPAAEQCAVVEVAEEWTRIDVYSGKTAIFSRMLRTGYSSFVRGVLESYSTDLDPLASAPFTEAQMRKLLLADSSLLSDRRGITHEYVPDMDERMSGTLERLTRQVERTFEHFSNSLGYPAIEHIYLATPGGCLKMLGDYFSAHFNIPCTPLHKLRGKLSPRAETELAGLGTEFQEVIWSIGLSLGHPAFTLNLNKNYQERHRESRQRRVSTLVSLASLAVVGLTVLGWMFLGMEYDALLADEAALQRQLKSLDPPVDELSLTTLSGQVISLRRELEGVGTRQAGVGLMYELSRLTPESVNLTGMQLSAAPDKPAPRRNQPVEVPASAVVTITGFIQGDVLQQEASLADFLYRLEQSPIVAGVSVNKLENAPGVNTVLQFIATVRLV